MNLFLLVETTNVKVQLLRYKIQLRCYMSSPPPPTLCDPPLWYTCAFEWILSKISYCINASGVNIPHGSTMFI